MVVADVMRQVVECTVVPGTGRIVVLGTQGEAVIQAVAGRAVHWWTCANHLGRLQRSRLGQRYRLLHNVDVVFCLPPLHTPARGAMLMLPMIVALAYALEGTEHRPRAAAAGELCVDEESGQAFGAFWPRCGTDLTQVDDDCFSDHQPGMDLMVTHCMPMCDVGLQAPGAGG